MLGIKAKLDSYNQEFLTGFNALAKRHEREPLTVESLRSLYKDTIALYQEFPEYKAAVKLGILERDVKCALLDHLLEAVDNGEVAICPTQRTDSTLSG